MHDPTHPDDDPDPLAAHAGDDGDGDTGEEYEAAAQAVGAVIAWYSQQLRREHAAARPDTARIERLKADRQAAIADQRALIEAGPQEVARIMADYEARLRDLTQP